MHALFAHKSLQITFLPCICLFRGRVFPSPPAHDDGTVRRHTTCSPLEGERGGRCEKLPVSVQLPPCFLPSHRHPLVARPGIVRGFVEGPMRPRNTAHKVPIPLLCSCTQWLCTTPSKIEYREKKTRGRNEKEPPLPNPPCRRREATDGGVKMGISRGITPLISVVQWHCPKGVYTTPTPLLCNCTQ